MNHQRTQTPVSRRFSLSVMWDSFDPFCAVGLSLEELGMRALQRLPRDKAIDGILAFNKMRCVSTFLISSFFSERTTRDNLVEYLRPFAQEGQVVKEADVRSFFETLSESAKQRRSNI